MRGWKFLALALLSVCALGCCSGCDDTAGLVQPLPLDYQTDQVSILDGLKDVLGDGQKITNQLTEVSKANVELLRMHEEAISRLADQNVTNSDKLESLTRYVSTLEDTVKASASADVADFELSNQVATLQSKVAELEKRLAELDSRCQCGKVQATAAAPTAPVKSAVSGYGSSGTAVSSTVKYSYPQSTKSGGSSGSQFQSDPYSPQSASSSYSQPQAIVTEAFEVPDTSTCFRDEQGRLHCNNRVVPTNSRPRLFPNWKNR